MTPKEREELQRTREIYLSYIERDKAEIKNREAMIAELDAKLAEPEDWVPDECDIYEYIGSDGKVYSLSSSRANSVFNKALKDFNNCFQPGTGRAERVAPLIRAWLLGIMTAK